MINSGYSFISFRTILLLLALWGLTGCGRHDGVDAQEQSEESAFEAEANVPTSSPVNPASEPSSFESGVELNSAGDTAAAEQAYREAVQANKFAFEAWYNLGLLLYQQGRLDEAREAFLMVADNTRASRFNKVYYQLGLIAADTGDDAAAIKYYAESQLLDPSHAPSYINMAAAHMRMEEFAKARDLLGKALALDPGNSNVYWNMGLVAMQEKDDAVARASFEKVIELQPDYAPALFNLGLAAYREKQFEEARTLFHRAAYARADVPYPEAHYMLGKCYSGEGQFNAAINEYERALRLNPDYMEAAYNLALNLAQSGDGEGAIALYRKLATRPDAPPEALNNLAAWHLAQDEAAKAIPLLRKALELDPAYATAAYNLGLAELRLDNFPAAVEAFRSTVGLEPGNFAAWKNLGIAHARMEAHEPALEAMQQALRLDPADADTAVYVVKYLKLLNKPEQLVTAAYRMAYEAGGRNPLMLRHLAGEAFDREDYPAAVVYYKECIKFRPTTIYVYNLGLSQLRMDDFSGAVESFKQAIQLDPGHFPSWKNLGIAYSRMDELEPALEAMQRAFALDPTDSDTAVYVVKYLKLLGRPEATVTDVYTQAYAAGARDILMLRHLAREANNQGDYGLAAAYYGDYVKLRPTAPYYYNLGLALRKAERFAEARDAYGEALKLDPTYTKAWVNLGYIHAFLGDAANAEQAFNRALEIDPGYANAISALAELKSGLIKP